MIRRACGVDVHKDSFVATILTSKGCETRDFEKSLEDIEAFRAWLKAKKCRAVAMESTGVYWETVSEPGIRMRFAVQDLIFR